MLAPRRSVGTVNTRARKRPPGRLWAPALAIAAPFAVWLGGALFWARRVAGTPGPVNLGAPLAGTAAIAIALAAVCIAQLRARRRAESALRGIIERQSRVLEEVSATSRMMELLQVCHSLAEMAEVICGALPKLLTGVDGAFYVARGPENALELQARWGELAPAQSFAPEDCWALRRGHPHLYEPQRPGIACVHAGSSGRTCLCVPLVADGHAFGVLHLNAAGGERILSGVQRLAATLTEQLALAVGNLKLQESLRTGAERDPLTELYNRRHLEISLQRELARAQRHGYAVSAVMLDVDHFKDFNDANGHEAGDAVLREVAQVLKRHTRAEDIACRWGGEEFLLVLPGCVVDDAFAKAEAIREAIAQLRVFCRGNALPRVTASLGIACHPVDGERMEDLINAADAALYHAKAAGRDRVVATDAPGEVVLFDPPGEPRALKAG